MIDKAASRNSDRQAIGHGERNKLLVRVGVAVVLIVALIVALALFEETQKVAEPEAPGVSSSVVPPVTPMPGGANQASGSIQPPATDSRVETPAEPERTAAPVAAKPAVPEKTESAPEDSHPRLVVGRGGEPSPPHKAQPAPPSPGRGSAPEQAPREPVAETPVKPVKPEASVSGKASNGFILQVGVFSNLSNAEDLRRRLADAGIPAHIEARVQAGPFASQAEAVAAQQKLRALGMEPGMLIAPKRP